MAQRKPPEAEVWPSRGGVYPAMVHLLSAFFNSKMLPDHIAAQQPKQLNH